MAPSSLCWLRRNNVFDPANAQQLRPDYVEAIRTGLALAPAKPQDPPEQWSVLDFPLPTSLGPGVPRWSGRFGADGPDAMVALTGDRAVYAWKDDTSRGFGEGAIVRQGHALLVEPWAGVSLVLEPLPDNALQVSYERQGERFVTQLHPV